MPGLVWREEWLPGKWTHVSAPSFSNMAWWSRLALASGQDQAGPWDPGPHLSLGSQLMSYVLGTFSLHSTPLIPCGRVGPPSIPSTRLSFECGGLFLLAASAALYPSHPAPLPPAQLKPALPSKPREGGW